MATAALSSTSPLGLAVACMYCTMPRAEPPRVAMSPLQYCFWATIQAMVSAPSLSLPSPSVVNTMSLPWEAWRPRMSWITTSTPARFHSPATAFWFFLL